MNYEGGNIAKLLMSDAPNKTAELAIYSIHSAMNPTGVFVDLDIDSESTAGIELIEKIPVVGRLQLARELIDYLLYKVLESITLIDC